MCTIFSKIINREIPGHIVVEDKNFIAFLDIFPIQKGHTLVVPKKEVDYIFDLDDDTLKDLHLFAKKVAKGLEKAVKCSRIGTVVMGLEIPHAHIHLIPINDVGDINFTNPKLMFSKNEFQIIAKKIRSEIQGIS